MCSPKTMALKPSTKTIELEHRSCNIPDEALRSFVRGIMPDMIAFFVSEEGRREHEKCLKTEEGQKTLNETE